MKEYKRLTNEELNEMIEEMEMAKIICNAVNNKELKHCDIQCNIDCLGIAKELLKHYQPKLPKDSVVISKEEYENYQKTREYNSLLEGEIEHLYDDKELVKKIHDKQLKKERKETAEKIFSSVKKILDNAEECYDADEGLIGYEETGVDKNLTELAKQFGVEIKE